MRTFTGAECCCSLTSLAEMLCVCCSVLQFEISQKSTYYFIFYMKWLHSWLLKSRRSVRVAVCCSVLQCVAVCCSVLQCVAVCRSVSQCDPFTCSSSAYISNYSEYLQPTLYMAATVTMGWLRLVGCLKLQVSLAKEPYKRDDILQKRPIILRSLLIVATPYIWLQLSLHMAASDPT